MPLSSKRDRAWFTSATGVTGKQNRSRPCDRGADLKVPAAKGTSLSLRSAPSAGDPLANAVSECKANDQSDCSFQHWSIERSRDDNPPVIAASAGEGPVAAPTLG